MPVRCVCPHTVCPYAACARTVCHVSELSTLIEEPLLWDQQTRNPPEVPHVLLLGAGLESVQTFWDSGFSRKMQKELGSSPLNHLFLSSAFLGNVRLASPRSRLPPGVCRSMLAAPAWGRVATLALAVRCLSGPGCWPGTAVAGGRQHVSGAAGRSPQEEMPDFSGPMMDVVPPSPVSLEGSMSPSV